MSPFDQVTDWQPASDGTFTAHLGEEWLQGRSIFGGLLAAGCARLAATSFPDRMLKTIETRFFEPVFPGSIEAKVEVLRAGRSVAHVQVDVWQEGRRCTRATAVMAVKRASQLHIDVAPIPADDPGPEALVRLPVVPGVTPIFLNFVDMRFHVGIPFMGGSKAIVDGWCKFEEGATGLSGIVGLADVWPAPLLATGKGPMPASTVHWCLHLFTDAEPDPDQWYRYQARTIHAEDGMTTFQAWLWAQDGTPILWSEQLAVVFDVR